MYWTENIFGLLNSLGAAYVQEDLRGVPLAAVDGEGDQPKSAGNELSNEEPKTISVW